MKKIKLFRYCEYCNRGWEVLSPPTNEEYKSGLIEIKGDMGGGIMLLNEGATKKNGNHAVWFEGIYCNLYHLTSHLQDLAKGTGRKSLPKK